MNFPCIGLLFTTKLCSINIIRYYIYYTSNIGYSDLYSIRSTKMDGFLEEHTWIITECGSLKRHWSIGQDFLNTDRCQRLNNDYDKSILVQNSHVT